MEVAAICDALCLDSTVEAPEEPAELFSVWQVM